MRGKELIARRGVGLVDWCIVRTWVVGCRACIERRTVLWTSLRWELGQWWEGRSRGRRDPSRNRSLWKGLRMSMCSQHCRRSGLQRRMRGSLRWGSYTPRVSARSALKLSVFWVRAPLHNRVGVDGVVGGVAVCDRARVARLKLGPWMCGVLQRTGGCVVTQAISIPDRGSP